MNTKDTFGNVIAQSLPGSDFDVSFSPTLTTDPILETDGTNVMVNYSTTIATTYTITISTILLIFE